MEEKDFAARREQRRQHRQKMMRRRMTFFLCILLLVIVVSVVLAVRHNSKTEVPQGTSVENADASIEPTIDPKLAEMVIFPQEPEKPADILEGLNQDDGVKVAYLTFDDGPTKTITPQILDILRRYNVKATFFQVGTLIEENPDMARRVHDEGHLLANHSYAHNYSKLYETEDGFITEIEKTDALIREITGVEEYPKVFRFPGGGYNSGSWGESKQAYKKVLAEKGFRYCDWNALNGDAEGGSKSAEQLLARVQKTAVKEDVVILMHDAATKKTTAEALEPILQHLIEEGYTFKRLDQA